MGEAGLAARVLSTEPDGRSILIGVKALRVHLGKLTGIADAWRSIDLEMTDPKITGHVTLGLRDFYAASFWSWSARARWAYVIGFVAVVAYTLWIDDAYDLDSLGSSIAIPLLLIVLGVAVWFALLAFLFARLSPQQKKVDYEIDHERVLVRDASGTTTIRPWAQVTTCQEHKTGFTLRIRPMGSHWLVKRAFAPTELQALRVLINSILGNSR